MVAASVDRSAYEIAPVACKREKNLFAAPPSVSTEIFTRLPDELRVAGKESAWTVARGSGPLDWRGAACPW
jgi:hypothetical protein